ncbi:hypothetical protein Droror1_Dr00014231 [Drosera rotundifolia]
MAMTNTRSAWSNFMNANALLALRFFIMMLLIQGGYAFQFRVGGKSGWTVPADGSPVYNQWADNSRFQIGDSLLFVYSASSDSVLRVTKDDYKNCNTSSYIEKYTNGHTVFTFNQSGPYYFISGDKDNCLKNEKLVVAVLADRSKKTPPSSSTKPTASPAPSAVHSPPPPSLNSVGSTKLSYAALVGTLFSSLLLGLFLPSGSS